MNNGKARQDRANGVEFLDQGVVITGDVLVKVLGMKLLPINVRLLITSASVAEEMGLDWWQDTPRASTPSRTSRRSKTKPAARSRA